MARRRQTALLAKTSVVVLLPVILLLIYYLFRSQQLQYGELAVSTAAFLAVSGLLAGWYYVRNWLLFGDPFLGGNAGSAGGNLGLAPP